MSPHTRQVASELPNKLGQVLRAPESCNYKCGVMATISQSRVPLSRRISFAKYAPLRVKVSPKASDLAHAVVTLLAELVAEPGSLATTVSSWVLLPAWVWLPVLVDWSRLPVGIDAPSQPGVFERAWEPDAVAVKLFEPRALLFDCFAKAART